MGDRPNKEKINVEKNKIWICYGYDAKEDRIVDCPADTATHKKTITKTGHQMALLSMDNATSKKLL